MPHFNTLELLNNLQKDVDYLLDRIDEISSIDDLTLNKTPGEGKWSIAQIIEHLNTYNRYYVTEIQTTLGKNKAVGFNSKFKSGFFGNYFTKMMLPGPGNKVKNKMKAAKSHSPVGQLNSAEVIRYFLESERQLKLLLEEARNTDLAKIKIPISISKLVKLTLGDTFRFVIAHQLRHFVQIQETLELLQVKKQDAS